MKIAKWCNNRAKVNLIIDAFLLIQLMAMAGIGFLIKYILVPGEERNLLYGRDVELSFLGLTRHDWGKSIFGQVFPFWFLSCFTSYCTGK